MADKYRSFGKQRGNKLWEGSRMILPEHRAYMLELERKQEMIERPNLDEENLQEMSRMLSLAIIDKRLVTLTIYTPYELDNRTILPTRIRCVDPDHKRLFCARRTGREPSFR